MSETLSLTSANPSLDDSAGERKEEEPSQIDWKSIVKPLSLIVGGFLLFFFLPVDNARFTHSIIESLALAKGYAQEHVLLCLVPAFFIAGALSVFVSQGAVTKYLGAGHTRCCPMMWPVYPVRCWRYAPARCCPCSPVSGNVVPAWARPSPSSIQVRRSTFWPSSSQPAYWVLKLESPGRVGAVVFSVVNGLIMHLIYKKEEEAKVAAAIHMPEPEVERPLWQTSLLVAVLTGLLVSATWGKPAQAGGLWSAVFAVKWLLTGGFATLIGILMVRWMRVKLYRLIIAVAAVRKYFP